MSIEFFFVIALALIYIIDFLSAFLCLMHVIIIEYQIKKSRVDRWNVIGMHKMNKERGCLKIIQTPARANVYADTFLEHGRCKDTLTVNIIFKIFDTHF